MDKHRYRSWAYEGLVVLVFVLCVPNVLQAMNFSFTGTFGGDDDVELFSFSIGTTSTVTMVTRSYAGGILADGTIIQAGGFDPILSLFDSTGDFVDESDDGESPDVGVDPDTEEQFDAFLQVALAPGDYTLALTQFDNFARGFHLSDGFELTGDPFFTAIDGCSNGQFCDGEFNRTNRWALDILNVEVARMPGGSSVIPEPSTLLLLGTGLIGLAGWRLCRRK